jgi:hypothetical protein
MGGFTFPVPSPAGGPPRDLTGSTTFSGNNMLTAVSGPGGGVGGPYGALLKAIAAKAAAKQAEEAKLRALALEQQRWRFEQEKLAARKAGNTNVHNTPRDTMASSKQLYTTYPSGPGIVPGPSTGTNYTSGAVSGGYAPPGLTVPGSASMEGPGMSRASLENSKTNLEAQPDSVSAGNQRNWASLYDKSTYGSPLGNANTAALINRTVHGGAADDEDARRMRLLIEQIKRFGAPMMPV